MSLSLQFGTMNGLDIVYYDHGRTEYRMVELTAIYIWVSPKHIKTTPKPVMASYANIKVKRNQQSATDNPTLKGESASKFHAAC
jgi:hypothetical protein